ncbi:hypothetical protein BV898_10648 [Hypsibius exemplaris]|uniref:Uncharacterized protein n=1 Tax=Hypsibius exemplaris TaxID=2072580 RepID=A0A1W0WIU5_HYPEX|nr:hypothetical protein BV898_10648 [Hypsibius exemplaris]
MDRDMETMNRDLKMAEEIDGLPPGVDGQSGRSTAKYRDKWRDNFLTSFCCPNRQQREVLAENVTVVELRGQQWRHLLRPPATDRGHDGRNGQFNPIAMISCKSVPRQHVITTSPPSKVCGLVMNGQIVSKQFVPLYAYPEIS